MTRIASGLTYPTYATQPAGDSRIYILEQAGRIRIISNGQLVTQPFLNMVNSVGGADGTDSEKGLLGLAFHPSYASNGRFFVFYNRNSGDPYSTGGGGDVVVAEGHRSTSNPDVADATLSPFFVIPQNRGGHTGGTVAFGPDGMLYISNGDATQPPLAADPTSKYGKILRINVGSGPPTALVDPTVVHTGLRNPWRFSFDRQTGDMYIGDVGESTREEIDFVAAGTTAVLNFGWPTLEGATCMSAGCSTSGFTAPMYDYGRSAGRSVIGGYVYRGQAIPCLRGRYVFADYLFDGPIFSFVPSNGQATSFVSLTSMLNPNGGVLNGIGSLGEDAAGELFVVGVIQGTVYRLDPA